MKTAAEKSVASTPRGQATREKLLNAALRLFGERGYDGVTTHDIAREAGVSQGLIRFHFGSKGGLREAVDERLFKVPYEALDELLEVGGDGYFEAFAEAWRRRLGGPDAVRLFQRYVTWSAIDQSEGGERVRKMVVHFYKDMLSKWRTSDRMREDIDDEWALVMVVSLVFGTYVLAPTFERELGVRITDPQVQGKRAHALSVFMEHGLLKP
ncbi:MAG: TetR/AcrR family transcriptional regulator [Acidobacteriota bacterium]